MSSTQLPAASEPAYIHVAFDDDHKRIYISPTGSVFYKVRESASGNKIAGRFYVEEITTPQQHANADIFRVCGKPELLMVRVISPPLPGGNAAAAKPNLFALKQGQEVQEAPMCAEHTITPSVLFVCPSISALDFFTQLIQCGEGSLWQPPADGDEVYRILGQAVGKTGLQVRNDHYDFLSGPIKQLWPEARPRIIDEAKARLFVNGEKGNLGVGIEAKLHPSLWFDGIDFGFHAQNLQHLIISVDAKHPTRCATYVPVEGDEAILDRPVIVFWWKPTQRSWSRAWLKPGAYLPPVRLECWGKKAAFFRSTAFHAKLHQKFEFMAFRKDPNAVGCGCRGVAP